MGITGPAPKSRGTRARMNKDTFSADPRVLPAPEPVEPPDLPDDLLDEPDADGGWHPLVQRFWEAWSESPLSNDWSAVEWIEMEANAVLFQSFMERPTSEKRKALSSAMAKFGATPEDRLKLRISYVDASAKEADIPFAPPRLSARNRLSPVQALHPKAAGE